MSLIKPKIIAGMLVRNEAGRWVRQVCAILQEISDYFIVLDDASTDNTAQICEEYANKVKYSIESMWETNEVILRKQLFNLCMEQSKNENDWIMIIDADEIICNHNELRHIMLNNVPTGRTDVFTFKLYDMWSNTHYREDSFWNAHNNHWPMAFRAMNKDKYLWNEQALHCGRFPKNIGTSAYISNFKIKHMGWSTPEDREKKYDRYIRLDPNGKYGILEQYLSILDEKPKLVKFDD
jgi:glycosyltransferase involved in cell wall biosynthesis